MTKDEVNKFIHDLKYISVRIERIKDAANDLQRKCNEIFNNYFVNDDK